MKKSSPDSSLLPEEDALTALKRVFSIKDCNFDAKFGQACSGFGREERRIATLHSSSLCALLFFYNVTKEHPLKFSEYITGIQRKLIINFAGFLL